MDIQTRKIEFVQEFLKVQSAELITKLEKMLRSETNNDADFSPISEQEFNDRIDASMKDSASGKIISASDLKSKMKEWI